MQARIVGIGSYLPEKILTNEDLEKMVDTSDEWIVTRTGMKERRIASASEAASDLGVEAAKRALDDAKLSIDEIDYLLVATMSPDYLTPSTAAIIQNKLGAKEIPALDTSSACTGFLYTLNIAKALVESRLYKKVLVIATEKMSAFIDYKDRSTCVLFGDGAAAIVVSDSGPGLLVGECVIGADGSLAEIMKIPSGGSKSPATATSYEKGEHYLQMEGREIFKQAVRRMTQAATECLKRAHLAIEQIRFIVPHQANARIISAISKALEIDEALCHNTLHKYGNTSASSIGIALDELQKETPLEKGDNVLLLAFGGGLTFGAILLTKGE